MISSPTIAIHARQAPDERASVGWRRRAAGIITALAVVAFIAPATAGAVPPQEVDENGSEDGKSATAACPPGRHVVGAGGETSGSAGEVVMDDIMPHENLESVTVTGYETNDYSDNWSVKAKAICL